MNQIKHKFLPSLLALSLLALTACGDSESTSDNTASQGGAGEVAETITLNLWHYYNGSTKDALDVMIGDFNDSLGAEKNIFVVAESYSSVSGLATAVEESARQVVGVADMPHIFSAYSDTAMLLDGMGMVADMDQYFSDAELALFQQDFLNEGRFSSDGGLKIIPVAKSTELLFINETDFQVFSDATGIPLSDMETWEGLAAVAEAYHYWTDAQTPDIDGDGRALFGVDSEANFMLVAARQMGEEMYHYDGDQVSFGLSETAARKIWDTLMVPYIRNYYAAFGSYRSDDVKSGDLLMYAGSTSSVNYFPDTVELGRAEAYDIQGIALPFPYFRGQEQIAVQQGAGMVVSKTTTAEESAAAEFLKWFTSAENNMEFAVSTGYIPVQNQALSYANVLAEMQEASGGELSQIVESSLDVVYNLALEEYEFYSNRPFDGSYDTRNAVSGSFNSTIEDAKQAMSVYEQQDYQAISKEEAYAILTGDESFTLWYENLAQEVNNILDATANQE